MRHLASIYLGTLRYGIGAGAALLIAAPAAQANAITNGNFEAGNLGFVSAYVHTPGATATTADLNVAQYVVTTDPSIHHRFGANFGDHTTGSGKMLMANAATDARVVWSQTVAVLMDTNYVFGGWAANWLEFQDPSPADLVFEVDGVSIGTLDLSGGSGVWEGFSAAFFSGARSSVELRIRDTNTDFSGNDFALDDISLTVPEPSSLALLGLALVGLTISHSKRQRR